MLAGPILLACRTDAAWLKLDWGQLHQANQVLKPEVHAGLEVEDESYDALMGQLLLASTQSLLKLNAKLKGATGPNRDLYHPSKVVTAAAGAFAATHGKSAAPQEGVKGM